MDATLKRLHEDYKDWLKHSIYGITVELNRLPGGKVDFLVWKCKIRGKRLTIWQPGEYKIWIYCTDFPSTPPKIQFFPKIFHPNVDSDGMVVSSYLQSDWSQTKTIRNVLAFIRNLLTEPNTSEAVNNEANFLCCHNPEIYKITVMHQAYAMQNPDQWLRKNSKSYNERRQAKDEPIGPLLKICKKEEPK